ncbi:MAG: MATE family efflux transporter, partial [Neglectibacter timonensis]
MKQDSTVHNLTDGSVRRQLTRYALPMVAISLLQALYSMTDIIISGHFVGNVGISAINNSGQVLGIVTNIAIGVTMGGNILISQFFGAGDQDRRKEATGTLFSLSLLLGVFGAVLLILFARPMLVALGAPALEQACDYLNICALGLPMIFGYNALSSVLRAVGNSKTPMHIVIAATLLNVALDLLFVGPLQMGTKGAAAATVIAQTLSFLLALLY